MRASRLVFLLVKRNQRGVPDSARNNCAKMFQNRSSTGISPATGQSSQVIEINGTLPERYPATHFMDEPAHRKHTQKSLDAQ